jgi:IgGFc binding protein
MRVWLVGLGLALVGIGCNPKPRQIELPPLPDAGPRDNDLPVQVCKSGEKAVCSGNKHYECIASEEFIESVETDCSAMGLLCDPERKCVACSPGDMRCKTCGSNDGPDCNEDVVQACNDDGSGWKDVEQCDLENAGEICSRARCQKACEVAEELRGYVGCEFYAADLDNAALSDMNNASAQQYAIAVANPNRVPVEVRAEFNTAAYGEPANVQLVERRRVAPGDLEVFKLPRREVDGSTQNGLNDGTHTAVSSAAYRITSLLPITAYQFNPLENVNVFSNDASLVYPTSALGSRYTVVGWPQTIGDSDNPEQDFDNTTSNDDLRAFLTILGTEAGTKVDIELGTEVVRVVGAGPVPESGPGGKFSIDIGPFDVINLETQGFNADFTGTSISANHPVSVFVGSEASDVPMFGTYAKRQCCADHLEEQLLPDTSAGNDYLVGRMPQRTKVLNAASTNGTMLVANKDEPEWIRVVATSGKTHVRTTLAPPDDDFVLQERGDRTLRADRDVLIRSDSPIQVLQALGSQGVTGIPRQYPGGDPSIIAVPPIRQYRRDYIFLTPDKYIFDFVNIMAPRDARIRFDGGDLPDTCETTAVPGWDAAAMSGDTTTTPMTGTQPAAEIEWVVHRCQLAFPKIKGGQIPDIQLGEQRDGVHTIVSDREVAIIVYGFDRFVSYAYVGGLDFDILQ